MWWTTWRRVQEIFGEQLQSKAAECTKPGFDLLHGFLEDEGFLTKERFAEFKKCFEEACLIATALPKGDAFRAALPTMSELVEMAFLCHGPEKDSVTTKYAFIKQANLCAEKGEGEVMDALTDLAKVTTLREDAKLLELAHLHGKLVAQGKEVFVQLREAFVQKLDQATVKISIPSEVETMCTLDSITSEFLDSQFNMKTSSAVSDKAISMSTLLRDVSVACSYMGIKADDFLDLKPYEINNREGLTFLCLDNFGCLGFFWLRTVLRMIRMSWM